jgi:hypothetical protein
MIDASNRALPGAPLRVVVAVDSFKGSLDARAACAAIARGILRAMPAATVVERPMADGGEGTLDALLAPASISWSPARPGCPSARMRAASPTAAASSRSRRSSG